MKTAIDKTMPSSSEGMGRVDGRLKVTGAAKYAAEYAPAGLTYGVLVGSTITKGSITAIDTKAAVKAPGVLAVITHLNSPKVPGQEISKNPAKPAQKGPLKVFYDDKVNYNGQPIAIVIADTFERALFAASLVKAEYKTEKHITSLPDNRDKGFAPHGDDTYKRGTEDAWKT